MGSNQNCDFSRSKRQILISVVLILVSSSTHLRFITEGARPISGKLTEAAPLRVPRGNLIGENVAGVVVNPRQIGSRPPRCDRRCGGCGQYVAVQVSVAPQSQRHRKPESHGSSFSGASGIGPKNVAYSRGDDITNYKPMSWKCKCGNLLFNP